MNGAEHSTRRRVGLVFVALLVVVSAGPGVAAAQTGIGETVVVEEGETVASVDAVGGAIIVHGTVTGDVSGAAGTVVITGTVDGDVDVATGSLVISGHVGGDVSAGAGSIHLEDDGTVGGDFTVGAAEVRIDGTITGDARIGAETIVLGEAASIAGSLTYDGTLEGNREAVAGDITRDRSLGATTVTDLQPLASLAFAVYAFIANLLLGAVLLSLFPRFSEEVADRVIEDPVQSGLVGLGVLIAVPVVFVALLITVIGIPLALAGLVMFVLLAWVGLVYGRFALGMWLLSLLGGERTDRTWVALLVGLLIGGAIAAVPYVGGVVNLVIFLLGLGALALGVYGRRNRTQDVPTESRSTEAAID